MSDDDGLDGGFWRNLGGLAHDWVTTKRRDLRDGRPQTFAESGGSVGQYEWGDQSITQSELKQVKQVRETGGLAAQLFHAKALMRFGTGVELTAESDALQAELRDLLPDIDTLALALGEDATFYPYGLGELVETNGGQFSHIEPVEPWTTLPDTDDHGSVVAWIHHVDRDHELRLTPDDIGHIAITRASGRDKVGISDVLRAEDEIEQYKANQQAINNAIEVAGFPHHVWQVGAEGGTPVSDDELRRYRTLVEGMAGDTQFIVGPDVEHSKITPADFDFAAITERDLRLLTAAIGLPFEIVGYGSDGLGSGHEADLKLNLLRIQNEAARRRFADQFRREFLEPIVKRYTDFDAEDETYGIAFDPFLDDKSEMADWIATVGDYMRNEDVVERFDLPPIEDEEVAESYRTPKEIEEAEEGPDEGGFGGGGGLFRDGRALQGVPDNARPISDPSECDGSVIEGPQGGTYCVPSGEDGDGTPGDGGDETAEEIEERVSYDTTAEAEDYIEDNLLTERFGNEPSVDLSDVPVENANQVTSALEKLTNEQDLPAVNEVRADPEFLDDMGSPDAKAMGPVIVLGDMFTEDFDEDTAREQHQQLSEQFENSDRANAAITPEEVMVHEYAHTLQTQTEAVGMADEANDVFGISGDMATGELTPDGEEQAREISEYAAADPGEHFAEAFTSYQKGETERLTDDQVDFFERFLEEVTEQ